MSRRSPARGAPGVRLLQPAFRLLLRAARARRRRQREAATATDRRDGVLALQPPLDGVTAGESVAGPRPPVPGPWRGAAARREAVPCPS